MAILVSENTFRSTVDGQRDGFSLPSSEVAVERNRLGSKNAKELVNTDLQSGHESSTSFDY